MEYTIELTWDDETRVWIATSADIPGLALESGSCDALIERARYAAPELLELNGVKPVKPIGLAFRAERRALAIVKDI